MRKTPARRRIPGNAVLMVFRNRCRRTPRVSGVASGSLHGWLWIAAALPGTWIGVRLRPLFGLTG